MRRLLLRPDARDRAEGVHGSRPALPAAAGAKSSADGAADSLADGAAAGAAKATAPEAEAEGASIFGAFDDASLA